MRKTVIQISHNQRLTFGKSENLPLKNKNENKKHPTLSHTLRVPILTPDIDVMINQTRKIKKGRRREKEQLHEGEEQEQEQEQKKEITTQGAVTVLVV